MPSSKLKNKKDQIEELLENQNFILDAVKNLNERLEAIESSSDIDGVIVKNNSDDIALMKKIKKGEKRCNKISII